MAVKQAIVDWFTEVLFDIAEALYEASRRVERFRDWVWDVAH